jgi:hypothetical protein
MRGHLVYHGVLRRLASLVEDADDELVPAAESHVVTSQPRFFPSWSAA